jgi:DNA repair exonuclease SbcCD ATPase subunit
MSVAACRFVIEQPVKTLQENLTSLLENEVHINQRCSTLRNIIGELENLSKVRENKQREYFEIFEKEATQSVGNIEEYHLHLEKPWSDRVQTLSSEKQFLEKSNENLRRELTQALESLKEETQNKSIAASQLEKKATEVEELKRLNNDLNTEKKDLQESFIQAKSQLVTYLFQHLLNLTCSKTIRLQSRNYRTPLFKLKRSSRISNRRPQSSKRNTKKISIKIKLKSANFP